MEECLAEFELFEPEKDTKFRQHHYYMQMPGYLEAAIATLLSDYKFKYELLMEIVEHGSEQHALELPQALKTAEMIQQARKEGT